MTRLRIALYSILLLVSTPKADAAEPFYSELIPNTSPHGLQYILLDPQGTKHVLYDDFGGTWYLKEGIEGWETPINIGSGHPCSAVIDALGNIHFLQFSESSVLEYVNNRSGEWITDTIGGPVRHSSESNYFSLAIDDQGNPHVVFISPDSDVRYASRYNGIWSIETLGRGGSCSIMLDDSQTPCVAYSSFSAGNLLIYMEKKVDGWESEIVTTGSTRAVALVIGPNNRKAICFVDTNADQGISIAINDSGTWDIEVVDPTPDQYYVQMQNDALANLHIVSRAFSTAVRYSTFGEAGSTSEQIGTSANTPAISIDSHGLPHIIYRRLSQDFPPELWYTRQARPIEIVAASSDTTLYENGVDVAEISVRTHCYDDVIGTVQLYVRLIPSFGDTIDVGSDMFSINVGENHVSEFDWPVPGHEYSNEYTLELTVEYSTDSQALLHIFKRSYSLYCRATLLPIVYVRQFMGLIVSCEQLDPQTECLYQMAATVPIFGTIPGATLFAQNMCKGEALHKQGKHCQGYMAYTAGMLTLGKMGLTAFGLGTGTETETLSNFSMFHTAGLASWKCWNTAFSIGSPCAPQQSGIASVDNAAFADSVSAWFEAGTDSTDADVADAISVGGNCFVYIEADSSWTDVDSTGINYAHISDFGESGKLAAITHHAHALQSSEDNPHSEARFHISSIAEQPIHVCLSHYNASGELTHLRYPAIEATEETRASLSVRDDEQLFPILIDIDGNGSVDSIIYPEGVTGVDPYQTTGLRTQLKIPQPNPFNTATAISFSLASKDVATVSVFDASGRLVATPLNQVLEAGSYTIAWDGRSDNDRLLPSGVYFCQLNAGSIALSQRLIILR